MELAKKEEGLEIFVMIRPRAGDFLYDAMEYETMKRDVMQAKKMGFDGIVTGFLHSDGSLDLEKLKEMVELAAPLKVVLHRAFDDARQPDKDIPSLIDIGVERILTSGQRKTAIEGVEYISSLQDAYGEKITIMPGSGVNAENIERIYRITGCTQYHISGKVDIRSGMEYRECIKRSHTPLSEFIVEQADFKKIHAVKKILNQLTFV